MKTGSLVRLIDPGSWPVNMCGIVIGWRYNEPVVFWNEEFPSEKEYKDQLEVVG
jgi:hypothetical protein